MSLPYSLLVLCIIIQSLLVTQCSEESFIFRLCRRNNQATCEYKDLTVSLDESIPALLRRLENEGYDVDRTKDQYYRLEGVYKCWKPTRNPPKPTIELIDLMNGFSTFRSAGIKRSETLTNTRYKLWSRFKYYPDGVGDNMHFLSPPSHDNEIYDEPPVDEDALTGKCK